MCEGGPCNARGVICGCFSCELKFGDKKCLDCHGLGVHENDTIEKLQEKYRSGGKAKRWELRIYRKENGIITVYDEQGERMKGPVDRMIPLLATYITFIETGELVDRKEEAKKLRASFERLMTLIEGPKKE